MAGVFVSSLDLEVFRNAIRRQKGSLVDSKGYNNRPVQDLNDRVVYFCALPNHNDIPLYDSNHH